MSNVEFYPLGTIVTLEGGNQKIMITSRGVFVEIDGMEKYFDYAGVPYPIGLINDEIGYFNCDKITQVIFEGYYDDDDNIVMENINRYLANNPDLIRDEIEA